jgi:proton-translocating NADH-quinone oxidoreductase chain N
MMLQVMIWLLLGMPAVYLAGRLIGAKYAYRVALIVVGGALVLFADTIGHGNGDWQIGSVAFTTDGLSLLVSGLVLTLSSAGIVYSGAYMAAEQGVEKYYAMLLAMTASIIGLVTAADLFQLWLWFEAMTVTSYLLVAFYREQSASLEATFKYLIQSAVGSSLILVGVALTLAQTGMLTMSAIAASPQGNWTSLAGVLFFVGFGVKAALVPLHTWLPDAHSQAPSAVSALLSGVVIESALVALLRVVGMLPHYTIVWGSLLIAGGVVNMLIGNLMALRQTEIKRLLAYSSLTHGGYILFGIGVSLYAGTWGSAQGSMFHIVSHGLMKAAAFLAAGTLLYGMMLANGRHDALKIEDLAGAARRYPFAAFVFSACVLGLGGLPPMVGFMSKWQIFTGVLSDASPLMIGLVLFAAANSVLSLAYYAPLVHALYRSEESAAVRRGKPIPISMVVPLAILLVLVFAIGLVPGLLEQATEGARTALFAAWVR